MDFGASDLDFQVQKIKMPYHFFLKILIKVEGTCFAMILIFDEKYGKMRYTLVLLMMVGNVQILIQGHETKNDLFKKR